MEQIFIVKGLDCANCARLFEEKVNKINGIDEATMNFMSQKLIVKTEIDVLEEIVKIANNFEDVLTVKRIK